MRLRTWRPVGVLIAVCLAVPCMADSLMAGRFGVFPTVQYIENWEYTTGQFYSGYQFNVDSLKPTKNTSSVNYHIDDWFGRWGDTISQDVYDYPGTGTQPMGEEPYDTEAYYFDDDIDKIYFATIIGFHSPADGIWREARSFLDPIVQGDFAIDIGMAGSQVDGWNFNYNYGVNLTPEIRPAHDTDNVSSLYGSYVGTDVYYTTDGWYVGTPDGAVNPVQPDNPSNAFTNFDPSWNSGFGMTKVGEAEVQWYQLQLYYDGNPVEENNWPTYVIEITIPRNILPTLNVGDEVRFRWLAGCRNDGNDAEGFITGHGTITTPEPGTAVLFALGAGPLALWLRRRKQSGEE